MLRANSDLFTLSLVVVTLACLWAPAAEARVSFLQEMPNSAAVGCPACHVDEHPYMNWLGADTYLAYEDEVQVEWGVLYAQDSDGDGQTNGMELGDPCGVWTPGDEPLRTTEISDPGDPESISASTDEPSCGDGAGAEAAGDASEGCYYSVAGGPPVGAGLLAGLAAMLVFSRRRREGGMR